MISFVNFARIASICVGFHLGTLHGYFFHQDFWPNLNFLLEDQIKLVLSPWSLRRDLASSVHTRRPRFLYVIVRKASSVNK